MKRRAFLIVCAFLFCLCIGCQKTPPSGQFDAVVEEERLTQDMTAPTRPDPAGRNCLLPPGEAGDIPKRGTAVCPDFPFAPAARRDRVPGGGGRSANRLAGSRGKIGDNGRPGIPLPIHLLSNLFLPGDGKAGALGSAAGGWDLRFYRLFCGADGRPWRRAARCAGYLVLRRSVFPGGAAFQHLYHPRAG